MLKWGCYLEEEERVPSSSGVGGMETIASVPEEIVGSSLRRCGIHFTPMPVQPPGLAVAASGDGEGAETAKDLPPSSLSLSVTTRLGGVEDMR